MPAAIEGGSDETHPPTISALRRGRCHCSRSAANCMGARLPRPSCAHDCALRRGRAERHYRSHYRAEAGRELGPAFLRRKHPGRGWQRWHSRSRKITARWLLNRRGHFELFHQSRPVCKNPVRSNQGFCTGNNDSRCAACAGGSPSFPANDVNEFVAAVRANPGKYSYASAGVGQSSHLAGELFKLSFGLDLIHVPFNGAAPAMISTIGGHTPISFISLPAAAAYIKDGKLRALAVTSGERSPAIP